MLFPNSESRTCTLFLKALYNINAALDVLVIDEKCTMIKIHFTQIKFQYALNEGIQWKNCTKLVKYMLSQFTVIIWAAKSQVWLSFSVQCKDAFHGTLKPLGTHPGHIGMLMLKKINSPISEAAKTSPPRD